MIVSFINSAWDGVLYTDFSEDAALSMDGTTETERACELLWENVMQNFSDLSEYRVFMMGKQEKL